jgi:glycosyltransferase involved in cell wall biosynthesis
VVAHLPAYGEGPFPRLGRFDEGFVTLVNPSAIKGLSLFLELARRLPQVAFAAVPTWATTAGDLAALERLPNVTLLPAGPIDQILSRTRALVVPSLWKESFGLVVMEAMLRGVPVLASDSGGLPWTKQGVDYVLPVRPIERYEPFVDQHLLPIPVVPPQDVAPWEAALRDLLGSRALYERLSEESCRAAQAFVAANGIDRFEAALVRAVGAPALPPPAAGSAAPRPGLSPAQRALLAQRLRVRGKSR